jgi:hypothetical protein
MASLSSQELNFFQKYANTIIGLSISFNPDKRPEPVKFFIRCTLQTIGLMKGHDDVGLFVLEIKSCPEQMIMMMGDFMEAQERIRLQYEDYGKNVIRMTPDVAKLMGYNLYATISTPASEPKRIQLFAISSKTVEHLEATGAPIRASGITVSYQFFFQKYRVLTSGTIIETETLPQGMVRTKSQLPLNPELIEIIHDYWYTSKVKPASG